MVGQGLPGRGFGPYFHLVVAGEQAAQHQPVGRAKPGRRGAPAGGSAQAVGVAHQVGGEKVGQGQVQLHEGIGAGGQREAGYGAGGQQPHGPGRIGGLAQRREQEPGRGPPQSRQSAGLRPHPKHAPGAAKPQCAVGLGQGGVAVQLGFAQALGLGKNRELPVGGGPAHQPGVGAGPGSAPPVEHNAGNAVAGQALGHAPLPQQAPALVHQQQALVVGAHPGAAGPGAEHRRQRIGGQPPSARGIGRESAQLLVVGPQPEQAAVGGHP